MLKTLACRDGANSTGSQALTVPMSLLGRALPLGREILMALHPPNKYMAPRSS